MVGVGTASCEPGGGSVEVFDVVEEVDRLGFLNALDV
jgi:hypothetical protein